MSTPTDAAAQLADADRCVRCGLCLPHCPTFQLQGLEAESPRGRVVLAEALARGELAASPGIRKHLESCLSCGHCERVCPARVPVTHIIARARRMAGQRRVLERAALYVLAHPRSLNAVMALLRGAQRGGWLRQRIPRLAALPTPQVAEPARCYPALGKQRGRIALLPGCIASHLDQPLRSAAVRILTRLGYRVTVPWGPACCGALHRHWGEQARADQLWSVATAGLAGCDAVLTTATGCSSATPRHINSGSGQAVPVRDLCDFLLDHCSRLDSMLHNRTARVLLHVPCTRRNGALDPDAERKLLALFPNVETMLADPGTGCCGAAGTHFLSQAASARAMAAPLLVQAREEKPDCILSSNIACTLHLTAQLLTAGLKIPMIHPVQFIAGQLKPT